MAAIVDLPRAKLIELLSRSGDVGGNAERCARLVDEACGGSFGTERAALLTAIEHRVTVELARLSSEPRSALLDRLTQRLVTEGGLSPYLARWSVEAWALAYGVVPGGERARLVTIKLEELAPTIEQAGSGGALGVIDIERLLEEARIRGIGYADAWGYLSRYAAAHGWQIRADSGTDIRGEAVAPPAAANNPAGNNGDSDAIATEPGLTAPAEDAAEAVETAPSDTSPAALQMTDGGLSLARSSPPASPAAMPLRANPRPRVRSRVWVLWGALAILGIAMLRLAVNTGPIAPVPQRQSSSATAPSPHEIFKAAPPRGEGSPRPNRRRNPSSHRSSL